MGYERLTEEQEEQIRSMRKAGKSVSECVAFVKTTYHIDLPAWKISYCVSKGPGGYASKKMKKIGVKSYHKKDKVVEKEPTQAPAIGGGTENAAKDIVDLLNKIFDGYNSIFYYLRMELIKKLDAIHKMQQAAGIEAKEDKKENE